MRTTAKEDQGGVNLMFGMLDSGLKLDQLYLEGTTTALLSADDFVFV
jgi:hypothetical protein